MSKIKITVIKRFSPEDVFGHEYKTPDGKVIEKCHFEDGQESEGTEFRSRSRASLLQHRIYLACRNRGTSYRNPLPGMDAEQHV